MMSGMFLVDFRRMICFICLTEPFAVKNKTTNMYKFNMNIFKTHFNAKHFTLGSNRCGYLEGKIQHENPCMKIPVNNLICLGKTNENIKITQLILYISLYCLI